MKINVRDNNIDQAVRILKKKLQREGLFRELKKRRHFMKPSEKRTYAKAEAIRRQRRILMKRMEFLGY